MIAQADDQLSKREPEPRLLPRIWRRGRASVGRSPVRLALVASLVGLLASTPLVYILIRAAEASPGVWDRLWGGHIPALLANTVTLVITGAGLGAVLGVGLAWLVERTDLPGRSIWRWALALPLVVPAYVGALCYLIVFRRGGLVEQAAMTWGGLRQGELPLPDLYTLAGATLIVALFTFPYVYLPVSAALRATNWTMEEAARVSGRGPWGTFRSVTLPLLSPALLAGMLLISLYILSDFGTMALLRYRTFTVAIYNQFVGDIDRSAAAILSFVLVALTIPLLVGESLFTGRNRRYTNQATWKPRRPITLGKWRWPALALVGGVLSLALLLPMAVLGALTLKSWFWPTDADRIWRVGSENMWAYGLNSVLVAGLAATLAVMLAFAPAYLAARYPRPFARVVVALSKVGYALPGVIVGLGMVMLFSNWLPALYGTVIVLVLAFATRFLPQAIASIEAALKSSPASLEQAARTMGRKPWQVFRDVTLPVAAPGLIAGWTLVFLTAMKELPTAILLRPPGFDTLPVRIWAASSESVYTQAAPPAFLLLTLTMLALGLLSLRRKFGLEQVLK